MVKKANKKGMPAGFTPPVVLLERTANQKFVEWANEIIRERKIGLGDAFQETGGADRKQPDVIIFERPQSDKVLCVIELKPPVFDVYNYDELKKPAYEKAMRRNARYYAVSNFRTVICYSTERTVRGLTDAEQTVGRYELSAITNLEQIREPAIQIAIKNGLARFLPALYEWAAGVKPEPKRELDEILLFYLRDRIAKLSEFYYEIIKDRAEKDKDFRNLLRSWFNEQSWNFTGAEGDYRAAGGQTATLLLNKIIFYKTLQAKHRLSQLEIPAGTVSGKTLKRFLEAYFEEVLRICYKTIYTTDFIDEAGFPEDERVIEEVVRLVDYLKQYDFSQLGFEIIGHIFEDLIPADRRHELGQYYTSPDVVDLILALCIKSENDVILDPGCGAGTFLVRAYRQKKQTNPTLNHDLILETLYGFDIAKFPAHLTYINLAINDLGAEHNRPRVFHTDFFKETPRRDAASAAGPGCLDEFGVPKPELVDAVVGNPPYTRQEEITKITGDTETAKYKTSIIETALYDNGEKLADISKRAGIHAYFFVHGYKFLKEGGRFGFVVSNSWLDVGYGAGLQEFFLSHYKIVAIIESKIERWFPGADVNTCIVILERCPDSKVRDENPVRFVYLKRRLAEIFPRPSPQWEGDLSRRHVVDDFAKLILAHEGPYENEEIRIHVVRQKNLREEGYDPEKRRYVGAKWGKYLRAPAIYFKILEKCAAKLVPLKEVAEVRRGFTTGANEFFYLTEEEIARLGIEKEFWMHNDKKGHWVPNILIKSPREIKTFEVQPADIETRVLIVKEGKENLKNKKVYNYVKTGEARKIDKNPTCSSRGDKWYELPDIPSPDLLWIKGVNDRHFVPVVP